MSFVSDRVVIMGWDGTPRFIIEDGEVRPHPKHLHVFHPKTGRCTVCKKTEEELEEAHEHSQTSPTKPR